MQPKLVHFPKHVDDRGMLYVYESGQHVSFTIQRVFTVRAREGDVRGGHAHKQCTQLLICVSGKIRVTCDNGLDVFEYLLDDMGVGLFIPPGIWAQEEYIADCAVMMVLCDHGYEASDYIRDYSEFQAYLKRGYR